MSKMEPADRLKDRSASKKPPSSTECCFLTPITSLFSLVRGDRPNKPFSRPESRKQSVSGNPLAKAVVRFSFFPNAVRPR